MNHSETSIIPPSDSKSLLSGPLLVNQQGSCLLEMPSFASLGSRLGGYLSLLITLRAKHAPTAAHSLRVAQCLSAWGLYYQLPSKQIEQFELAGLLHDMGKIGIPERILQKPSPLLPEERVLVEIHPLVGLEILQSAGVDPDILEAIRQMGSWYDNSNRNGQTSEQSLIQRMLSIADAFDSMTSEQTYRRAMGSDQALYELHRMSGSQFDPRLVGSFAEVVRNTTGELRSQVEARWQNNGISHSMVHLFQHQAPTDREGSVAIQTLNLIFHRQMMDHMNDGAIFVDTESRILEWNRAAERLTGLHRSAVLHSDWEPGLIGLTDERGLAIKKEQCPIQSALQTGQPGTRRLHIQQPTGKRLRVEIQMMPIFDERGILRGGAMLLGDASEQAGLEEKMLELHAQATQDPLTKVANRAELTRRLQMFVRNAQTTNKPSSVLICDIDFFKRINDTHGHAAGDEALKVFAMLLKDLSRNTDLVARYGGEEFVILCDDCDLKSAIQIGENIRQRLQRTPVAAIKGKCMTASFGVSQVVDGDKPDDPLERADKGLLQAKQTGRDRVVAVSAHELLNVQSAAKERAKARTDSKQSSSWLSWLGSSITEQVVKADLLSSVPRGIAIEKLKGFVAESKAEIIDIQLDFVHLRVDCRYAPMTRRDTDRPTIFEMRIEFIDVDVVGTGRGGNLQRQTRLGIQILASRQRDRRIDAVVDQANRLRLSIQAYLVAQEIDANLQERLVPVYKPGADGR